MWIIDRINDDIATVEAENEIVFDIPVSALPEDVREGDCINICKDIAETQGRKEKINNLMNSLFVD